jgi:hypothetical protein
MVELGKEGRKVRHRLRLKHRVDETQEAWISRFEDASRKATEKGEDVKQVRGGEVVFTYAYQRNSTVPVIWQWSATLYCTSSFLGFLFFLSCEYNFSPSLYSPLLRHRPLSSHRRIFQKREHLAPRRARAASKYIQLTSHKPDTWLVYVGRPDGRWWAGAWRVSDMEKLAVCASTSFSHPN